MKRLLDRRLFLASTAVTATALVLPLSASGLIQGDAEGRLELEDHGGRAAPGHDNGAALRRALAAAAPTGAAIMLRPGLYEVASTSLLRDGAIRRPPGVALIGAGRERTAIRVTGSSIINQLFRAEDSHDVVTRGIRLVGNGVKDESAPYAGGLMFALLTDAARRGMTGVLFEDCDIENFASAAWFYLENQSPRHAIGQSGSRGCNWRSFPGTCPGAGAITVPGHFVYAHGQAGPIEDLLVADRVMDATHIKGGIGLIGNVNRADIRVQILRGAGQGISGVPSEPDGPGAYALLFYQKPYGAPRNLAVTVDRLESPFSCGVYSAGGRDMEIHIGHASGQRDLRDATLFKGIFVLLGGRNITARIDNVEDCNRVVMISLDGGQDLGSAAENINVSVHLGRVVSRRGARDVTIDVGGTAWAGGVTVTGARSGPAAVGVHLRASDRFGLQNIDLSGFSSTGAATPVVIGSTAHPRMRGIALPRT